jgi:hypothetical protein
METKNIPAKTCFSHIGGTLGNLLLTLFIEKKWIVPSKVDPKYFIITEKGKKEFETLGIDLSLIKKEVL